MKIIIDGNNIAYASNSANPNISTKAGERTGAIFGVLRTIQSYLKPSSGGWKNKLLSAIHEYKLDRTLEFDEVIVCWDGGKSKWRRAIYKDYKGHRDVKRAEKTQEEQNSYFQLLDQMQELHEILPHFGVRSVKVKSWEADDLVYAVKTLINGDDISIIVSTDRDMLQLVDENTFVWSPVKEKLYTPENFTRETGVPKQFYLTYRILVGDKSDNIDGIYGIGDKKAKDLIIKYGDIRGIQSNAQALMKSVVTKRILENPDILKRNEELMDMRKIPLNGVAIDDGERVIKIDGVQEEVERVMKSKVTFERDVVKMFLISKQFVSLLKDFTLWSNPFTNLK